MGLRSGILGVVALAGAVVWAESTPAPATSVAAMTDAMANDLMRSILTSAA